MEAAVRPLFELHVCIVNWRTAALTIDCLHTVAGERGDVRLRVYVVDNASGDGSDAQIRAAVAQNGWQEWVEVISAGQNGGFAYGNNLAIDAALRADPGATNLLLLNPDTLVRPGAFRILLDFMKSHPDVGLAGGSSEDPDGTRQCCAFRFPSPIGEFISRGGLGFVARLLQRYLPVGLPAAQQQVDWVSGAYLLVRRQIVDQIGMLDEGYFLYFEETDFILRARRAGWTCWHVPESRIVHLVGQSSGVTTRHVAARRIPAYWFESRRRYYILNHGRAIAILADLAAIAGHAVSRLKSLARRTPGSDPPHFIGDVIRHGALFKGRGSLKPVVVRR